MKIDDVERALAAPGSLSDGEFLMREVPPGSALRIGDVAGFDVAGRICATQARCTHRQGPLSEGTLDGSTVTCPWHGARFDVCSGAVVRGPARVPLQTYPVVVQGGIGRIAADRASRPEQEGAPR
jgi:nitrite reductase/ring-hydroxylating ferredoxin subunit